MTPLQLGEVEIPIPDTNKDLTIKALMESNEILGEMILRYRRVTAYLRRENSRLRMLKNIQYQNDLEFKALCQSEVTVEYHIPRSPDGVYHIPDHVGDTIRIIDVDVPDGDGGLPDPTAS